MQNNDSCQSVNKAFLDEIVEEKYRKEMAAHIEVIQLLKASLLSEDPNDYGEREVRQLSLLVRDSLDRARENNERVQQAIAKIEARILEVLPPFSKLHSVDVS